MTQQQKETINKIYESYLENKSSYSTYVPDDYCSFDTYRNEQLDTDKNIVVEWTRINGLSSNLLPQSETLHFLIEPTGFYYDMISLKEVFPSQKVINKYIENLTKFDWNGK